MSTLTAQPTAPSRALNYTLWAVQIGLALAFFMAGQMKAFTPTADLVARGMDFAGQHPGLAVFIGVAEMAGAAGLILPMATRVLPRLTAVAAAALTLVMVLAAGFHLMRAEYAGLIAPVVLGGLSAFVAWGRRAA